MSVTAVSAISYSQDQLTQGEGLRHDLLSLQQALAEGNLASAQRALNNFQQALQSIRPQRNGIRSSAEVNPSNTMRSDMQALQSALDSGDLAMAEEAFVRMQQDSQKISGSQAGTAANGPGTTTLNALVKDPPGDAQDQGLTTTAKSKGNLLDVMA